MKLRRVILGMIAAAVTVGATALPANASTDTSKIDGSGVLSTTSTVTPRNVLPDASISARISNIRCFTNGITFTARTQENGRSGVQQFRQTAFEQVLTTAGWATITPKSVTKSTRFPNDFRNFYYQFNWSASHPANGASYRVIWQGFYLNGAGFAIFKTRPIAVNCF